MSYYINNAHCFNNTLSGFVFSLKNFQFNFNYKELKAFKIIWCNNTQEIFSHIQLVNSLTV